MNMEFFFKNELTQDELAEVEKLYNSLENVTIEQHPKWWSVVSNGGRIRFFFSRLKSQISSFAVISETKYPLFGVARISFGPLFVDPEVLIESIIKIRDFYKELGFSYLEIQLAIQTGNISEYVEYKLSKQIPIKYVIDRNNWTSLTVDLSPSVETILKNFSKGHKSAIKKSATEGVHTRKIDSPQEIDDLSRIYHKMNVTRGLSNTDRNQLTALFKRIHHFLENQNLGYFLGVFDQSNIMVGGIIVIFQGNTVRYYKGASDPERKDIAILHVAIFEAIKISKQDGYKFFDLWGYNHLVDETDQIFYVNRFKKGFSDNFLFYPKIMHISLKPAGYFLYKKLMGNQRKLKFLYTLISGKDKSVIKNKA